MRASLLQIEVDERPCEERVARIRRLVAEEASAGAQLIVLPELWTCGFFDFDAYADAAVPVDGWVANMLAELARQHGVTIIGGSFVERAPDGMYNTTVVYGAEGRCIATYRKMHLFPYRSREPELLRAGDACTTFDAGGIRFGLSICFDLRFPELYRELIDQGAEVLVIVSAWPFPRLEAWKTLLAARAIENQAIVLACNAAGVQRGAQYLGHSMAFDAWGTCLGALDERPGTLRMEMDYAALREARKTFPALALRSTR